MNSARNALIEILEGVDAIDVDASAKEKFRNLVGTVATTHGYDWIERANRIVYAKRLLAAGTKRPEVRDRLMALYEVSRPQAYRIISNALTVS